MVRLVDPHLLSVCSVGVTDLGAGSRVWNQTKNLFPQGPSMLIKIDLNSKLTTSNEEISLQV